MKDKRFFAEIGLFFIGLFLIDQSLFIAGNYLIRSPFWPDNLSARIRKTENWDILLMGDCRAYSLNQRLLHEFAPKRILNAGIRGSSIVAQLMQLALANDHVRGKSVVIFLDKENLSLTRDKIIAELWSYRDMHPLLDKEIIKSLLDIAEAPRREIWLAKSGLYSNYGSGTSLLRAGYQWLRSRTEEEKTWVLDHSGEMDPYRDLRLVADALSTKVNSNFAEPMSAMGEKLLRLFSERVTKMGLNAVIIIPPVFTTEREPHEEKTFEKQIRDIAKPYSIRVVNFRAKRDQWTRESQLWADRTHMNGSGRDLFARQLATSLSEVLR